MLDLLGPEISPEERELLIHPQVGGVILFTRNYIDKHQLRHLVKQIRENRPELLIAVDQEGGRVQRFKTGFTELPAVGSFGETYAKDPNYSRKHAYEAAKTMASELLAVGIDFSFAPVLDIRAADSAVIGDRSFHQDVDVVIELARAFIEGLRIVGMASVGKHFPGHGSVVEDTHTEAVYDPRNFSVIEHQDLKPFAALVEHLTAVMPAHIIYNAVDSLPAGFSRYWLHEVLREQLHFSGAVFSDDLNMTAGQFFDSPLERAQAALEAGCDMVLYCNHRAAVLEVLDGLCWAMKPESRARLLRMKPAIGR